MLKEENGILTADRDSLYPLIFGRCTEESQHRYETGKTSNLKIKDWVVVIAYPDFRVYDSRWMDDPELGRFCVTPDVDIAFSTDMVFPTFAEARKAVGNWWIENMAPETTVTPVENVSDEKLPSNLHDFSYNGSSTSGRDTYYKCKKCDATQTVTEPYALCDNQRKGCIQTKPVKDPQ